MLRPEDGNMPKSLELKIKKIAPELLECSFPQVSLLNKKNLVTKIMHVSLVNKLLFHSSTLLTALYWVNTQQPAHNGTPQWNNV